MSYEYLAGSLGLVSRVVEPLTDASNRWTEYTYNANNDVTQLIVSQAGSTTLRTITRYCHDNQASVNWWQTAGVPEANTWRYGRAVDQHLGYP